MNKKGVVSGRGLKAQVKAGLQKLAFGDVSDAVRLIFMEEEPAPAVLREMDLYNIAELKRSKGGFEVKLFDRFKALEALAALCENEERGNDALPFYKAIAQSVQEEAADDGA